RKEGDRVRITAQLVRADNGVSLWTESYDRQLAGVFATQEEIAHAIAGALRAPLGLQAGESLVSNRAIDPEGYQEYLRAVALYKARDLAETARLLETIVSRAPNYAPAWALLSDARRLAGNREPSLRQGSVQEARK